MLSGTRLSTSQRCTVFCRRENIGKALNTASATVNSGTSEIVVVKVRLLAVTPSRSSRKRSRRVQAVVRQGKPSRSRHSSLRKVSSAPRRSLRVIPVSCHLTSAVRPSMSPASTSSSARLVARTRVLAVSSLIGLIVLGLAWELWLAPLRPGGSWLVLKVLPLTLPLAGLLKNRMYTYRWLSLLVWLYFTEGVVRATSESGLSAGLALLQALLCVALFVACTLHIRLRLRDAKNVKTDSPE